MPGAREYVDAAYGYLSRQDPLLLLFPTRSLDQALDNFAALPLTGEARERLLWQNAARLLGLEERSEHVRGEPGSVG